MLRNGICRSPISSDDDDDDDTLSDGELPLPAKARSPKNARPNAAADAASSTGKSARRKPKPAPKGNIESPKKLKKSSKKASTARIQIREASQPPLGAKDLIRDADLKFVQYLAQQLDVASQTQLSGEFGFGQGYMVKAPPPTLWKRTKERTRFTDWLLALGFTSRASVNRYLYRIASLRADIILCELHRRVVPTTLAYVLVVAIVCACLLCVSLTIYIIMAYVCVWEHSEVKDADDMDVDMDAGTTAGAAAIDTDNNPLDTTLTMDALEREPQLQSYKEHFNTLDAQRLEILSLSEHDRMLSSSRHMEIADAMESVLAQPSVRKEKSRARRLSRLGRIATGRRISIVLPTMVEPSSLLPSLVEEDDEDEENDEETMEWDEEEAGDALASLPRESNEGDAVRDSLLSTGRVSASFTQRVSTGGKRSFGQARWSLPRSSMSRASMARTSSGRRASSMEQSHRFHHHAVHKAKLKKQHQMLVDNVLRLVLHTKLLPISTLRNVVRHVSTSWRNIANIQSRKSMVDVYQQYPRGHYLSDGAYKEVHKVYSTRDKRLEAVSVMDIDAIRSTGNQNVVRQEIAHTILLSELVQSKFCPNFVAIYDLFVSSEHPRTDRWGSAEYRKPSELLTDRRLSVDPKSLTAASFRPSLSGGSSVYQYIQMEFCDGGDLEDFISLQDDKLLPLKRVVVPFFFQMVFSVYCARERFHFRHCDIKLLNFFLKDIDRERMVHKQPEEDMLLQYWVEDNAFDLRLPGPFSYWIKLADYGTADSNVESLEKPVALDQFTTLENTPIEFLLEGDAAVRSYGADTFALGLCLLHLLTGSAPYEEILDDVLCPVELLKDLDRIWTNPRKNSGFSVLKRVVKDDPEKVLYHTLYRYLVLFGLPEENPSADKGVDKVWLVLLNHLRPEALAVAQPAAAAPNTRRSRSATASARAAAKSVSVKHVFEQDRAKYSLDHGSNPMIARGRARMEAIPGARDALMSLVHFNPLKRPTTKSVLLHPLFQSLQAQGDPESKSADCVIDAYKRRRDARQSGAGADGGGNVFAAIPDI
ncbi:Serine/threonine protein kinase, partial [Globisporangium splendens]